MRFFVGFFAVMSDPRHRAALAGLDIPVILANPVVAKAVGDWLGGDER